LRAVGMKLISLFASGTCSRVFFSNNKQITAETEIDLPGGDYSQIELVKNFLQKQDPFFSDTLIEMAFSGIFQKLNMPEFSVPIESLASEFISKPSHKLVQFEIETILRHSGMQIQLEETRPNIHVSIQEATFKELNDDEDFLTNKLDGFRTKEFSLLLKTINPLVSDSETLRLYKEFQKIFER
jgi:hypothetical protein